MSTLAVPVEGGDAGQTRYFFIHVMKTGGTTLAWSLRRAFAADEIFPQEDIDIVIGGGVRLRPFTMRYLRTLPEERVRKIRVYLGHWPYVATEMLGGDFVTMTILRDPVDRTISLLRQFKRDAPPWVDDDGNPLEVPDDFEELYEHPRVFEPLVHNHQTKIFSMTLDDEPTGYMQTIEVDDKRLERAKTNIANVDIVGLTEEYERFVDELAVRLGPSFTQGKSLNVSPADPNGQSGSESLRRRIAKENAIDVEFYEYTRDLVARRHR